MTGHFGERDNNLPNTSSEEHVTICIADWLATLGWEIFAIDIPGAGSGMTFRSDYNKEKDRGRLKGSIRPDIVATKKSVCLLFENKPGFNTGDFNKQQRARRSREYENDIGRYPQLKHKKHYYGIGMGMPSGNMEKIANLKQDVDFIIICDSGGECRVVYQKPEIPFKNQNV